eukprot:TRINITY_DN83520_c0_g1_i1.p1 TRINITY_DN83520_c0_g1~~TRINITY_DN83520_c0_g1_i1.p1  ORF type:complete len:155 (+),score=2.65 TRINITY_DN83520_c0_g1_i1:49-513(+)
MQRAREINRSQHGTEPYLSGSRLGLTLRYPQVWRAKSAERQLTVQGIEIALLHLSEHAAELLVRCLSTQAQHWCVAAQKRLFKTVVSLMHHATGQNAAIRVLHVLSRRHHCGLSRSSNERTSLHLRPRVQRAPMITTLTADGKQRSDATLRAES